MESTFLFKSNEWSLFNIADYLTEWEKWHLNLIEKISTSQLYVIIHTSPTDLQNGTLMCANFLGIDSKEVDRHEIDANGLNHQKKLKLQNQSLVAMKETYERVRKLIVEKYQNDQFSKDTTQIVTKITRNSQESQFFNQTSCEWNFLSWLMPPGPRVGLCSKPGSFKMFFSILFFSHLTLFKTAKLNTVTQI